MNNVLNCLTLTQLSSLILGFLVMVLSVKLKYVKCLRLTWLTFFLMGFHIVVFYVSLALAGILGNSLEFLTGHFSFHDWSSVVRLHLQLSIIIILLVFRHQSKLEKEAGREILDVLSSVKKE